MEKLFKMRYVFIAALTLGSSILLWNCQIDTPTQNYSLGYETVSFKEALEFFNSDESLLEKSKSRPYVTLNFSRIYQEKLMNKEKLITIVPAKTIHKKHYSRALLMKIDGETKAVICSMYEQPGITDEKFTGEILITNLKGNFLAGYRVVNGELATRYIKKDAEQHNNLSAKEEPCPNGCPAGDPYCIYQTQELEEIEIIANPNENNTGLDPSDGGGYEPTDPILWDPGDIPPGGTTTPSPDPCPDDNKVKNAAGDCVCKDGYVEDANGKCVKQPCSGDPVPNPEIAPQTHSGIEGGLHDTCARKNSKYLCKGIKGRKWHNGVDIKNNYGNPIYAIYGGKATIHTQRDDTGQIAGAGHYVVIETNINGETLRMVYFHLQKDNRITGTIQAGDIIGYQGRSGNLGSALDQNLTVSHVHIKVQKNGISVNPLNYIKTIINPDTGQVINPCN